MASGAQVQRAESIIGYKFTSTDYLRQALTAAGAEWKHSDGNRALAQIGAHWFDTLLTILLWRSGASKVNKAKWRIDFTRKDHFTFAAKRTGISECIKYSPDHGAESPTVFRYAINAIIGAVLLDTKAHSISTTLGVITRVGFAVMDDFIQPHAPELSVLPTANVVELLDNDQDMIDPIFDSALEFLPSIPETDQMSPDLERSVHPQGEVQLIYDDLPATIAMLDSQVSIDGLSSNLDYTGVITTESRLLDSNAGTSSTRTTPIQDSPSMSSLALCPSRLPRATITTKSTHPQGGDKEMGKHKSAPYASIPDAAIQKFITKERAKCSSQHLPPPEETYLTPEIQNAFREPIHESIKPLLPLLITIGSPDVILSLRGMICNARAQPSFHSCRLQDGLSQAKRYTLIERLEHSASTIQLMRWYHIYELFRDCGGPNTVSSSGYANSTPASFLMGQKCLGNPVHHSDARVSKTMMKDIFPDIDHNTEEYRRQFRKIKRVRKLGQRLHTLIEKFGKGVLGLMVGQNSSGDFDILVSDTTLFNLTGGAFARFISLLESSQGESLRNFGQAVWGVLEPVLFGMLSEGTVFHIEMVNTEDILRQAKGSPGLLELIR
ncbi:hypothetical protein BO78DRAFT_441898 [Aspergillus sclerotiicarbonarius CBS 121057]|uniref:RNase III domain-containing protein n=1 Tax=Aspergillus sclerotiicarbonarius (strain CBS 121057 / IBT 28362) TaxID=1448318 RepID=A0A319EFX7_ASPSB|nr:hypothetical protein BO78DRAFT_441898 [Aspergillus sclerotiicarbonarius CBS 121057]